MALAKRQVNPSRSSIALRRMAPPSELACGWSNFAMIGLEIPWTWRALCAIQAVAIEPPRFCAMSRLVNALFAHFRGSMALFFHLSRIIRARTRRADWAGIREPMDRCRLPTHILDIRCLVLLARPAGTALVDRLRRRNSGRYTMLNVQRLTPQFSRPALAMLAPSADGER